MRKIIKAKLSLPETAKGQDGFTLIEAVIALVILLIVVAGVFAAFTYAATLNTGNSRRSQALSVLQKEVELLRSAKFVHASAGGADSYTPVDCDDPRRNLLGTPDGTPRTLECPAIDGMTYLIETEIDDDPFTDGQQIDATKHLKEIRVTVTQPAPPGSWETAYVTRAIFRRVRAN
jgi:prepilin-type N-terminal cleavage/methylation domain-containing protein